MAKKIQCLFVSNAKTTKRSEENMAGKETKSKKWGEPLIK
jgi:hypothetical protein